MFTFDTCVRFTHTYKNVIVQKINVYFKSTWPVYGKKELDLKVKAIFFWNTVYSNVGMWPWNHIWTMISFWSQSIIKSLLTGHYSLYSLGFIFFTKILTSYYPKLFNIHFHNTRRDVQPPFSMRTCQKHTAAKYISSRVSFKISLWNLHFFIWYLYTF